MRRRDLLTNDQRRTLFGMPADHATLGASDMYTEAALEPELPICDPHHHLWDNDVRGLYLLPQLLADMASGHRIESTVYIEAQSFYSAHGPKLLHCVGETRFAAGVAAMADSGRYGPTRVCAGIVGHADLSAGFGVAEVLEAHLAAAGSRFKGIRQLGAYDPSPEIPASAVAPPELYGLPQFRQGFARLSDYGLSFEAWQFHTQLPELTSLARAFPDTPIVVDHVGTPLAIGPYAGKREQVFAAWASDIGELAQCPNVMVKLGGLGMIYNGPPADDTSKSLADAWRPYIETCIELFGVDRAMFESNFPVERHCCSYAVLWNAFKRIAAGCSAEEKARLFHDNATSFYRLKL